jgi:hypothetical protein
VPLIDHTTPWYRLAAWCSNRACKRRPRLRASARLMEWARGLEPDEIVFTYQCHAKECNARYPLPAAAFHFAEPDPPLQRAA